jgi:AbrB family looped-hinge helix DNA binding protein
MQRTKVDRNGRVLLPAPIRRALGLRDGSELSVRLDPDGKVVLRTPHGAWSRAQSLVADHGSRESVVDELIQGRRAEFARENTGGSADDQHGG